MAFEHPTVDEQACREPRVVEVARQVAESVARERTLGIRVEGVHAEYTAERLCRGPERLEPSLVEPVRAYAGRDLRAAEPEPHRAFELRRRSFRILKRHRSQRREALRQRRGDPGQRAVVHCRDLAAERRVHLGIHQERNAGHGLHVDASGVHVGEARLGVADPLVDRARGAGTDAEEASPGALDDLGVEVLSLARQELHDLWSRDVVVHVDDAGPSFHRMIRCSHGRSYMELGLEGRGAP